MNDVIVSFSAATSVAVGVYYDLNFTLGGGRL